MLLGFHHVQLAMPAGGEAAARAFYCVLLGMAEDTKPEALGARGGCWFSAGDTRVHLGVEEDFRPARKAHPAYVVRNLAALTAQLGASGVTHRSDVPLPGFARMFVDDPFGNRIELMETT